MGLGLELKTVLNGQKTNPALSLRLFVRISRVKENQVRSLTRSYAKISIAIWSRCKKLRQPTEPGFWNIFSFVLKFKFGIT